MKQWFALTCPVCGFRYLPKKFNLKMKPILYPFQIVTGGGRAKGFKVAKYLPWETLPKLRQTEVWNSLLCLYERLGTAYDHFYEVLGFLSPKMKTLFQELQRPYADSYRTSPFSEYARIYALSRSLQDIAESYTQDDYPEAYAHLIINSFFGGAQNG